MAYGIDIEVMSSCRCLQGLSLKTSVVATRTTLSMPLSLYSHTCLPGFADISFANSC